VKTAIITLSAAILIAAAPAALASSKAPHQQVSRKHSPSVSATWRGTHTSSMKMGYPGASGYAPGAPKDYTYENLSVAGGGGGGGSGM
jgi:hypothetical protein